MELDQLSLRKMAFDSIEYDDDLVVIWRDRAMERILK